VASPYFLKVGVRFVLVVLYHDFQPCRRLFSHFF
jgi:hypothetical protein